MSGVAEQNVGDEVSLEESGIAPLSILAVIPTLNEEDYIEPCVRSLMTGDDGLRDVPLVVVDGGSNDATVHIVERLMEEFPNLSLLHNPKKLQSAAVNLAARESRSEETEWLVRCDAHSIYPENYILDVASALETTRAESIVVPMDAVGSTCFEKANAWVVDTPLGSGGAAHRGGHTSGFVDHGHHAGFSLDDFIYLGGYDETFSHNEDAEYDARLSARGGRIFLDADIRIQYVPRGSVSALAKQYFNYGKGRARNATKHKTRLKLRQMLPVIALGAIVASLLIAPFFAPAMLIPLGYLALLALVSGVIAIMKQSSCGLFAGVALGTMHMSWAAGFVKQKISGEPQPKVKYGAVPTRRYSYRSPSAWISSVGRSVLDLFAYATGRTIAPRRPYAANENFSGNKPVTRITEAPENTCIYAIGDIHGRFDLLLSLMEQIEADARELPEGVTPTIVFLGDYIDRGLQSRQIVDYFLSDALSNFETVFLMGNHEEALLNFVNDPNFGEKWAMYGGAETLFSYGLQPPPRGLSTSQPAAARDAWVTLWNQFRTGLPDEHLTFYQNLQHSHTIGDYVFVHAGLRPGVSIEDQSSEDMMWIREEFLMATGTFEKLVVHGHTPADAVYRDNRRIGLDTGAYLTGRLTAAKLWKQNIDYLST